MRPELTIAELREALDHASIEAARAALVRDEAALALYSAILRACPGPHRYDNRWCRSCGLDYRGHPKEDREGEAA